MRLLGIIGRHVGGNLVAYLALFMATTGTAYAVATIDSADVVNDSLQSQDLKDGAAVKSVDVRDDTLPGGGLRGVDVAPNTLTGADINELTLGIVPNADELDGLDSTAFESGQTVSTFGPTTLGFDLPQATLTTIGPFQFVGTCPHFGSAEGPSLEVKSTVGPWSFASQSHEYVGDRGEVGVAAGDKRVVAASNSSGALSIPATGYAVTASGKQITFNVYMKVVGDSNGEPSCTFGGDVIAAP